MHTNTDKDEQCCLSKKSKVFLPMSCVRLDTSRNSSTLTGNDDILDHKENKNINPHNLNIGSAVQCTDTEQYGVIKWIGTLSDSKEVYAGVEMVRP